MDEKKLLRKALTNKEMTQEELAKRYGYNNRGGIGVLLSRDKSMRVDIMVRLFDILGCDVYIFDKQTKQTIGKIDVTTMHPTEYKKKTI